MPRVGEIENEVITAQGAGGPQKQRQAAQEDQGKQNSAPGRLQEFVQGQQAFFPSGYFTALCRGMACPPQAVRPLIDKGRAGPTPTRASWTEIKVYSIAITASRSNTERNSKGLQIVDTNARRLYRGSVG